MNRANARSLEVSTQAPTGDEDPCLPDLNSTKREMEERRGEREEEREREEEECDSVYLKEKYTKNMPPSRGAFSKSKSIRIVCIDNEK